MNHRIVARLAGVSLVALGVHGCGGMPSMGSSSSAFHQLGGMDSVTRMASGMVNSSMRDPRLAGALGNMNPTASTSRMANQMCAALGGGCWAPSTDQQVAAAAERLTPAQRSAVSENFTSTLNSMTNNAAVRDAVANAIGSKMPGILGSVL
jgi:hypothetical protein